MCVISRCCVFQLLKQDIADHKPLIEKLNKTGPVLLKLVGEPDTEDIQHVLDSDAARFEAIRSNVRELSNNLDEALNEASEVRETGSSLCTLKTYLSTA